MYNCNHEVLEALFKSLTEEQAFELAMLFKNVELRSGVKGFTIATALFGGFIIGGKLKDVVCAWKYKHKKEIEKKEN